MIHLFKKVYVASEHQISLDYDRIVISEINGVDLRDSAKEVYQGVLIHYARNVDELINKVGSWEQLLELVNEHASSTDKRVMIYCDDKALAEILTVWFKSLLPNSSQQSIENLIKGLIFRYNVYFKGKFLLSSGQVEAGQDLTDANLEAAFEKYTNLTVTIPQELKVNSGVEFLLATYLSNGQMKDELKNSLKVLIRKDLEKYLFEVKEIFFTHILTRRFTKDLGYDKQYTYDNMSEILSDQSPIAQLFLTDRLWNYKFMSFASAKNPNINLEAFTPSDIAVLNQFVNFATACWAEEGGYLGPKSDANKMDFIGIYSNFTDELLAQIIDIESTFEHAAGTFFSIDLTSVNHYLITEILERKKLNDTSWIQQYSLV